MTDTQTQASTRTFHSGDYARAARLVQRARAVKGDRYTPRPEAEMVPVHKLATALAAIFLEDAGPEHFDASRFIAGTQIPDPVENVLLDSPSEDLEDPDSLI